MIEGIIGKVGSGKSLYALTDMLGHFCKGGYAASNIDLDRDQVARYCWRRGHRFRDDQYKLLDLQRNPLFHREIKRGTPALKGKIYIDEAHIVFPASEFRENKAAFFEIDRFCSQHRKFDVDIYFITQAWENLWGQIKRQATFIYSCRDFRVVSLPMVGTAFGSAMGLKWSRLDSATDIVLETGSTAIAKDVVACYSTKQVFDPMCAELMQSMPIYEPQRQSVSWFARKFSKPC